MAVVLFTADLRVHDHPPLWAAVKGADEVVPLFVWDEDLASMGFAAPNRRAFLAESLHCLDAELRARGGRLVVRRGSVADEVYDVVRRTGAREVHLAADVSRYAQRREERLVEAVGRAGATLRVHDSVCTVLPPGAVTPAGKDHFGVFTPYFRRWKGSSVRGALGAPRRLAVPDIPSGELPERQVTGSSPRLPRGGEKEGRRRVRRWLSPPSAAPGVSAYESQHDDLLGDATSRLSPYLHFGCVSPVELAERVREASAGPAGAGAEAFLRQLAWRDFHRQVLAARPSASHVDYRPHQDRWREGRQAEEDAEAWRQGRTGYPIVDAAMRQLREEGWMHNRGRLLAASFLSKTLYIDWRVGAAHFLHWLVDGDVANNQLNWQWVAGTGTDTRPNRVLNPLAQARRFDPEGGYVRRWVPELAEVSGAAVHQPWKLPEDERAALGYPAPLVPLDEGLARFRQRRGLE